MKNLIENFKKILEKKYAKDILIMGILVFVYSIISFIGLGTTKCPKTYATLTSGDELICELENTIYVSKLRLFIGDKESQFILYGSTDGKNYSEITNFNDYVLVWKDIEINASYKYFKIYAKSSGNLGELQFYNISENKIKAFSNNHKELFDEPDTIPDIIGYDNSAYFDEIYFAASAYEYANGIGATEWTHPHLGKILQTIPVKIFGFSPFTYRLTGNLAGIAMIIVIYLFGKMLFKKRIYGFIPAFLLAFDNFHFAQTRLGTVDGSLILFCMLSAFFMCRYFLLAQDEPMKKKIFNLFFSGLFFGCAVSVKWLGFYTGLGIAIIFFSKLIYECIKSKKFDKQYVEIIIFCIIFFILIPILIYTTCYFSFQTVYGNISNFEELFKITSDMYKFHSTLDASHPFSSEWYTWPLMLIPVWFHISNVGNNTISTITSVGNPAVWWFSIIGLAYLVFATITTKKKEYLFILIMFLSVWTPFIWIGRVMFLYHYFAAFIYALLATTCFWEFIIEKLHKKWLLWIYLVVVLILFFVFYPVSSGIPIDKEYADSLHWLVTWYF